jgi:hypothetical protein
MVSPLQDLANRIATNTLTGLQQSVLTTALNAIIPFFPGIDDTSVSVPIQEDIPLSREWIATLYTLQSLGSGGGSSVLPTNQTVWFIDPVGGNDANNGQTLGTALKTAAALGALWRGVSGGGRPLLSPSVGTTITINLVNDLPNSDPISVLLDVDLANSSALIFVGGAKAPTRSATLATVSAFARTAAAGQVKITDAGVADYSVFVGSASLFVDTVTGAVAWLYGPDGAPSATGLISPPYAPQPIGSVTFSAAPTLSTAGHAYTLSDTIHASVGAGFTTRSYPALAGTGVSAQVFFYRLHLTQPSTSATVGWSSPSVVYTLTECQTDEGIEVFAGGVNLINCFGFRASYTALGGTAVIEAALGGATSGTMQALQGGSILVDGDALVFSLSPYFASGGGLLEIGNAGYFTNGGAAAALEVDGGFANITRLFQATSILYGVDGGTGVLVNGAKGSFGAVLYRNDGGGTPAASQFQLTHPTFKLGDMTSPFGVTIATAAYVGPTTGTMAHLDAALAAGTGFGGLAVDNATLSSFRIAA